MAVNVGRTETALGAFYRRLAARIGKAKAVTATARKLAILFYRAMRFGTQYQDPGADQYEQRYRERVVKQLERRCALGLRVATSPGRCFLGRSGRKPLIWRGRLFGLPCRPQLDLVDGVLKGKR
ncbi:hypothetical protein [Roseateles sp. MS654]|uniref:hypothetical protein n=1 Tax=Roseateles sp. MS654 TaxID=3412685 RepID=UPI003C2E540B